MEHICVINDGKHIIAYGEGKKAINVELWDLTVFKKVNSAKLKHANLERGSCIDIISTKNYILTHYSCNDLSSGREHRHLELRDIDTFTKLSNKKCIIFMIALSHLTIQIHFSLIRAAVMNIGKLSMIV